MIHDQEMRAEEEREAEFGTRSELELLDALLDEEGVAAPGAKLPTQGARIAPLSASQRRLWFLHELDPSSHAYTVCGALRLKGALDVAALEEALSGVVARHASLRTLFVSEAGEPMQVVQDAAPLDLRRVRAASGEILREVTRAAQELVATPWNLVEGPLLRVALVGFSPAEHALIVAMHHIVADGWSVGILLRDLSALYHARVTGAETALDELPLQYSDYAAWQSDPRRAGEREEDLAYWLRRLEGAPQRLDLPTLSVGAQGSRRGAHKKIGLTPELTEALKSIGREQAATLTMTLLAAFQILISRSTGQEDFLVGSPVAGRSRVELQGLVGFFVNTLVLRADLSGNPTFRELLDRVRGTVLEALAHEEVPFERIVEALKPEREASMAPLFQVLFSLQTSGPLDLRLKGIEVEELDINLPAAKFDLTLDLKEARGELMGTLEFDADRFEEGTISRMAGHFQTLLQAIVADPGARLSELPLLTPEEDRQLGAWNQTLEDFLPRACVHTLFERQAGSTPDVVAVQMEERRLTYRELNERANQLAHVLRRKGVGPDRIVGLFMERSLEMVVAMLGIHKAGGAYLPLDPSYPQARQAFMHRDARASLLVTQTRLLGNLPDLEADVLALDPEYALLQGESPAAAPLGGALKENLAYVLYTSGSTGNPRGVMISHGALTNHMQWMARAFPLEASDVVLQRTSPSFDASVWEFFAPLISGARLFLAAEGAHHDASYLIDTLRRHSITTLQMVPSLLALLLEGEGLSRCTSLKRVFCGGESLSAELRDRFFELLPADLHNLYGPTEATIDATSWSCARGDTRRAVPIGHPIANLRAHVLDARLRAAPVGVTGELYLAGAGLARGYLGDPELTAERFIPDPFAGDPGARLYRTGDAARRSADGAIEYLGRKDRQVKLRGLRIEPGEIESVLAEHPDVLKAVVVVLEEVSPTAKGPGFEPVDEEAGNGRRGEAASRLAAYLVSRTGEALSTEALRDFVAGRLPRFMIPSVFQTLPSLPLTPNGKIDRRALATRPCAVGSASPEVFMPPQGETEEILASIWSQFLSIDRVSREDDFFELGGHSLLALRVAARLRSLLGIEVPLRMLFDAPKLCSLAARLDRERCSSMPPMTRANPVERRLLSYGQRRLWFLHEMDPTSYAYILYGVLHIQGALDVAALEDALSGVVARHESLRTIFVSEAGEPKQIVLDASPIDLRRVRAQTESLIEEATRVTHDMVLRPWNLAEGPLLRFTLVDSSPSEHVLIVAMHHIVADGWSIGVLLRDLAALYDARVAGAAPALDDLPLQYADFAARQNDPSLAGEREDDLAYWRRQLEGAPQRLDLPTLSVGPHTSQRGAQRKFSLTRELTQALKSLGRERGTTLYMTLLAAFQILISRSTGQADFLVGSPVAGRNRIELHGLVGFFVNTLILRADLSGDPTFREVLARVRRTVLEALAHQELPVERIVEALKPEREASMTPLFQVLFILQETGQLDLRLAGLEVEELEVDLPSVKFDLSFVLREIDGALVGAMEFDAGRFEEETIAQMVDHFCILLEAIAADPETRVSKLPFLSQEETARILDEWSGSGDLAPGGAMVHERFARQAAQDPERVAAVLGERRVTYGEIDERSNGLAVRLREAGIGEESRVGLCVDRSPELLVGILAVLKAGAAFVPLDPEQPRERLAFMLEDAGVRVALATSSRAPLLAGANCEIVDLEKRWMGVPPPRRTRPEALAYVIYTSGTTGRPKGVMVQHGSLAAAFTAWDRLYRLDEIRVQLQMAALGFDVCIGDVVRALGSGGMLVFAERERLLEPAGLYELVQREKVQFGDFVPAIARSLAALARERGERLDSFRIAVIGADVWTSAEIDDFRAAFGEDTRLGNSFGITEATIDSACWFVGDGESTPGSPPIGRPMAHTTAYLLDSQHRPVPPGVFGELFFGGPAVARGYLGRPDLTAARFVPDPFGPPGARLYRSGDRAWYLGDGRMVFAGRSDDQVKIRGQRIEPAEVEAALAAQEEVAACAVVARRDAEGILRLAAYVVPRRAEAFDAERTRRLLSERLPAAMIPSAIVVLEALPLSRNGKVDRKKLPEPEWKRSSVYEPPAGEAEAAIAAAYREVLGVERVGAADNFFDLGGHSLLATQVVSRIRAALRVEVPLRMIFESPVVRALAARIAALDRSGAPSAVLAATPEERRIPSYAQRRLWFLNRLDPDSLAYSQPSTVLLRGALDIDALARSLTELARRQEALRTRFVEGPAGPEQVVDPPGPVAIPLEDLSSLAPQGARAEAARRIHSEACKPFDLAREAVLRVRLFRLGPLEHILLLTLHHIVTDDWSTSVLIKELGALYEAYAAGRESPLGDLAIQYGDWSAWQRRWLEGGEMERQLAYWRVELDGAETLHLAADRPAPSRPTRAGASLTFQLPLDLKERLQKLAREEGATLMMALFAGYTAMLGRWSGQKDFAVGIPVANRRTVEAETLIGFFVNTLPVRARLGGSNLTFRELIRRTREACLGAYANQDVPFERIVETLQPDRYLGHNPLIQTLFAMQNAPVGEISLAGLDLSYEAPDTGVTRFDLELFLGEASSGLEGTLVYSTELFEHARMLSFIEELQRLLEAGLENPDEALGDLQALPAAQRRRLLHEWNAARVPYGDPLPIHALFEHHARRAPEAIAALLGDERLTYGELDAKASCLARFLRKRGVGVEGLVPVCIERSFDMLVALLGVLKAGAAYVPLDPEYPPERIALILEDVGAGIVLTQAALAERLPRDAGTLLRLDQDWQEIAREEDGDAGVEVPPDALVYSVYTSGSTGRPKGVAMSHRAIANLLSFQRRDSQAAGGGRTLQFASLSFDVSFQEIFSTLTAGGELVLVTEEERRDTPRLLRLLDEKRVERLFLPFVALNQLAETAAAEDRYPAALREIDTAGEQLKITPALRSFYARLPACRLVNHYGPSETHLVTTFCLNGDPSSWPALPAIGRAIPNAPVFLLDREGRLVPAGVPGELCVGGTGLARGYHARPDLTAERFVPDPFSDEPGTRLYRTGDLARYRPDGSLEFLGRLDMQVKIRGYRVEPGEIEAALAKHPSVRQAVVTAHEHHGGRRLAAHVVAHEGQRVTPAELREHLAAVLPEFMVPSVIMLLATLPLTSSGKVNRQALPDPDWSAASVYVAPRTPQEDLVCGIFAEVLGLSRVGAADHFFELGGHSLLATQVLSRVRRALGVELALRVLFESPTPAGIAAAVARSAGAPVPPPICPAAGARRNLLSYAQRRLWFLHRLEPGSSAYNLPGVLRLEGDLDVQALSWALTEIVRRHESLRTRFVEGPEGPEQVIDPPGVVGLEPESLPAGTSAPHETAKRLLSEEAAALFDLARGPMMRARLLRLGPREHVLSIVVHHVSGDGWSMGVLLRELGVLYAAYTQKRESPLPEPEVQYADWAVWQRDWLEQGEMDRQMACWRAELEGSPAALELPPDRERPATASWKGETLPVALPAELGERLARLARSEGATLQMVLLSGYAWTLMRHAGQHEIVVGTPVANRRAAEAEHLVGFFVNTLAVRVRAGAASLTFRELLARVREASLLAYANQDVPFERVVEDLQPARALNRAPLFQTAFALNSSLLQEAELPGLKVSPFEILSGSSRFDLMLVLQESPDGLAGAFEYSTDLFDRKTIEAIFTRLARLLRAAAEDPDAPLATRSLLDEEERRDLLREYALPVSGGRDGTLLHELFERQAARTPQAPAVALGDEVLTYSELDARAGRLAGRLRGMGVGPERRVAILLDRSLEAVVALLGVLKAGGAYVPLEPGQPEARLRFLVEDSGACLIITESRRAERVSGIETPILLIDRDESVATETPSGLPTRAAAPENLAYVIYTSGSTGRPKGVGVEHRQIAGYVAAVIERLDIAPGWRFGLVSTLAADLGNTALFPCLATGGCLQLLPPDLSFDAEGAADYFEKHPVDALKIVPSHLQALLGATRPRRVLPRRLLILGGEATPGARLAELRELAPQCRVANHYGPTEATVGAVAGFPQPEDAVRPTAPLGWALPNAKAYLLDERMQPAPAGMPGELYLAGEGVARGYLGSPDLTAVSFVPDPFAPRPGARMYRTGDRARRLPDGRLEFLGRADAQVKVRGHRVEPREIEETLKRHPEVREAAVITRPDTTGGNRLIAYVVPDSRVAPTVHGLARRRLPNGMAIAELNRNETDYIYREIFEQRAYLRHGITLREGDTILDIGANIGLFTLFASLVCPQAKILAFEPNPHLQPILRANLSLFAPGAAALAVGLSDGERSAEFTFFPGFSLLSGLHADAVTEKQVVKSFLENQGASGSEEARSLANEAEALLEERFESRRLEVRLRPLSDVLAEHRIERVGLLKLNAEKSELEVLRGIREEDWARIDQAVVEVDLREDLTPVTALFEEHGFQVLVDQDPLLARTDLHYLYAARKGSGRALAPGAPAVVEPPALSEAILTAEVLRTYLARHLPDPMLPSAWAFLEAMPLTANGKLDRARLPEPEARDRVYEAPRGDLERRIAEIWEQALGLERVGAHDNFFDLGGHSLLLARVHTALRRKLETEISIIELFRFPTVASLAARLAEVPDGRDAVKPDRQRGERRRVAAGGRARSRATGKGAQA